LGRVILNRRKPAFPVASPAKLIQVKDRSVKSVYE